MNKLYKYFPQVLLRWKASGFQQSGQNEFRVAKRQRQVTKLRFTLLVSVFPSTQEREREKKKCGIKPRIIQETAAGIQYFQIEK